MSSRESDIDQLLQARTYGADPFASFVERSRAGGLPEIQVSAVFGRALEIFARLLRAQLVLEVGTLGGYSAAWIACGLQPGGRIISLEIDAHHAEVARENLKSVGYGDVVDVRVGAALETLPTMHADASIAGKVDLAFIDADKQNNPHYLRHAADLARSGALVIVDNVVRSGGVLDADSTDPNIIGTREVLAALGADSRLTATALQTVGQKGHDGFALAFVTK